MKNSNKLNSKENIRYAVFILVFTLITFEVLLREMHVNEGYSELIGHGYTTYYGQRNQNISTLRQKAKHLLLTTATLNLLM